MPPLGQILYMYCLSHLQKSLEVLRSSPARQQTEAERGLPMFSLPGTIGARLCSEAFPAPIPRVLSHTSLLSRPCPCPKEVYSLVVLWSQ